jgi:hypothetical protein
VHEQIVHGLDVFCEQSHRSNPVFWSGQRLYSGALSRSVAVFR